MLFHLDRRHDIAIFLARRAYLWLDCTLSTRLLNIRGLGLAISKPYDNQYIYLS